DTTAGYPRPRGWYLIASIDDQSVVSGGMVTVILPAWATPTVRAMIKIAGQIIIISAEVCDPALLCSIDDKAAGIRLGVQNHILRTRRRANCNAARVSSLDCQINRARRGAFGPRISEAREIPTVKDFPRGRLGGAPIGLGPIRPNYREWKIPALIGFEESC